MPLPHRQHLLRDEVEERRVSLEREQRLGLGQAHACAEAAVQLQDDLRLSRTSTRTRNRSELTGIAALARDVLRSNAALITQRGDYVRIDYAAQHSQSLRSVLITRELIALRSTRNDYAV